MLKHVICFKFMLINIQLPFSLVSWRRRSKMGRGLEQSNKCIGLDDQKISTNSATGDLLTGDPFNMAIVP